jgi:hypothetical protein
VMLQDKNSEVLISNNYFARDSSGAGLLSDFSLQKNSPMIDAGYIYPPRVVFDFKNHPRRTDNAPDIGAYEFDTGAGTGLQQKDQSLPTAFPNPVDKELYLRFRVEFYSDIVVSVYNLSGEEILSEKKTGFSAGSHQISISVENLLPGMYLYTIRSNTGSDRGKFLIVKWMFSGSDEMRSLSQNGGSLEIIGSFPGDGRVMFTLFILAHGILNILLMPFRNWLLNKAGCDYGQE